MEIEIFSDVACPWCFIGKRRLERALKAAGIQAELRYRAFQLQPGLPADGVPAGEFFARKFGGKERMQGIFERVVQVGREEGIAFDFESQKRAPNTELAHRVIYFAGIRRQAGPTVEALFRGYFEQGLNLCQLSEVVSALELARVALDSVELTEAMLAGIGKEEVATDLRLASEYGIGGVPLFIFDQRYTVEGAQPLEHFARLIDKLVAEDTPHLRAQMPL
jgi:predicted DsbA family dithiol-disulfide isomerase